MRDKAVETVNDIVPLLLLRPDGVKRLDDNGKKSDDGGCCCGCLDDDFGGSSARRDFLADEPLGRGSFFVVVDGTTMAKTHQ